MLTRRVLGSTATAADLKDWLEFRSRRDDLPVLQATYYEDIVLVAWRHGVVLGPVVKALHDLLNRTGWWLQPTAASRLASGVVAVPSGFQGPGEAPLHQCGRGTSLAQTDANDAMNLQIRSNSGSSLGQVVPPSMQGSLKDGVYILDIGHTNNVTMIVRGYAPEQWRLPSKGRHQRTASHR